MNNYINPPEKLLHHIDRIAQIQDGSHPAPVNVEIDLSNRCNLGCQGCHFAHTHTRGPLAHSARPDGMLDVGDLMPAQLALNIIDQLAGAGVRSISWTGGGEPTLHPDFERIIRYAHSRGIAQGIYTNGTNIDPGRAAVMKTCLTWVYVSLDRANRKDYAEYKQVDRFAQAEQGISNLVDAQGHATIGIGFLVSKANVSSIPNLYHFGRLTGADYVQFRPEISFDLANPQEASQDTEWINEALAWFAGLAGMGAEIDTSRFEMYRDWGGHPYPLCHWVQMQTVITPNGKVWTCVNRRGLPGSELGDLSKELFVDIWQRSKAFAVDHNCRIMCRGHVPNLTLNRMMVKPSGHELFV
jgi:GTP 3',8-cyclase